MFKKLLLSASLLAGFAGTVQAQTAVSPCGADEIDRRLRAAFPDEVAKSEAKLQRYIAASMAGMNLSQYAKVTYEGNDTVTTYHIPLVFHVIHDYGSENVKDNEIYDAVRTINELYNKQNADTTVVLPIFRKIRGTNTGYIGKTKFTFHLAQRDPMGQPTNGITRRRHYVTLKGGDFGKIDGWARDSYINIWSNKYINNPGAAAYATFPTSVDNQFGAIIDGIMIGQNATTNSNEPGRNINSDNTTGHELGHIFGLNHTWGNTNQPKVACGDDGIDDTPPTLGHVSNGRNPCSDGSLRYDSSCSYNKATIGKLSLDSTRRMASTTVGEGISFRVYTNTLLDTVSFYPSVPVGSPYTIQIRQNGNGTLIASRSDSTKVAAGFEQKVGISAKLPQGTSFTMSFAVNPGAYKDTVNSSFTTSVPGAIYFTSDTTVGSRFNYFHKWSLRYGYFKIYDSTTYRSLYVFDTTTNAFPADIVYLPNSGFLVDYPDTANAENVMDYTYCSKMFTHGQSTRMRFYAASPVAQRNNLSSRANLIRTGIYDAAGNLLPRADLPPVADFSIERFSASVNPVTLKFEERMYVQPGIYNTADVVYKCTGETFKFINQSNRDTISSVLWDFGAGATPATSPATGLVSATFAQPGYATVSLTANSNAGSNTITRKPVYVADKANTLNPAGYLQEFNADQSLDRWPIFNYYNNDYKWEYRTDVGMYDKTSISYRNYDLRVQNNSNIPSALALAGSSPAGDFDDFFSPPFDLTSYRGGNVNINFYYSNASRSVGADIRDTLAVFASTDCGNSWQLAGIRSKGDLVNNGTVAQPFSPSYPTEWSLASIDLRDIITANATAANVLFRFRYRPGVSQIGEIGLGTGNHFYMDRIHISNNPVGVNEDAIAKEGFSLAPNPTNGATSIMLKNAGGSVDVVVSDITGKVVYKTTVQGNGNFTKIEVPANAISVRGMYLVQVNSNGVNQTQKLVVN